MTDVANILVVEDDLTVATALGAILAEAGWVSYHAGSLTRAYQLWKWRRYDIVIIDRMLPDGDGLELLTYLNEAAYQTKTVLMSNLNQVEHRIKGYSRGCDDYIGKPFSSLELVWRIKKLLRFTKLPDSKLIHCPGMSCNLDTGALQLADREIYVQAKLAQLLRCFIEHYGKVVSKATLLKSIWDYHETAPQPRTLDVYVMRLRQLLGPDAGRIQTVRGYGFKLV